MMLRHVIYLVCSDGDPVEAQRIARIANRLNEIGVTVITRDAELNIPTVKDIIASQKYKALLISTAMIGALGSKMFEIPDIKLEALKPRQTADYQLPKLRQQHTARARQEIKRYSLNPRVMKKQRGRRFR